MDWSIITNTQTNIDWVTLSYIAGVIEAFVVVVSAVFISWQIIEMRRNTQAQSYSVARGILQEEKVRLARKTLFRLGTEGKPLDKWTEEEIHDAETVCHTYDTVGQMVRYKLLGKEVIVDSWGPSIRRSWPIVSPLVIKYRKDWNANETWDDFEWLFFEAIKFDRHRSKQKNDY